VRAAAPDPSVLVAIRPCCICYPVAARRILPAMKIPCSTTEMVLADGSARSVDVRRRPVEVSCVNGEVLVTFEGDPQDHVVAAGGAFRVRRRGRLVVAALRPSRVLLAVL
jgi:hypothetical protein